MLLPIPFLKKKNNVEKSNSAFIALVTLSIVALLFLAAFSIFRGGKNPTHGFSILSVIALIAFCAFGVGAVIGFLFGIPRTLQHSENSSAPNASNSGTNGDNLRFQPNTNLEQISDWLTKIIIGVGLIQMNEIMQKFSELSISLGNSIAPSKIPAPQTTIFVGAVMIFFCITGFMITYLWTRLFLARIQDQSLEEKISTTVSDKLLDADLNNKKATSLANNQLNLPEGQNDIPEEELMEAFANASNNVIGGIFYKAVNVRKSISIDKKLSVARTIPIFKALIRLDRSLEFPENFAELGLAYMEKVNPDYKEALINLTKAIEGYEKANKIEGRHKLYLDRAKCKIFLDPQFKAEQPSTPESQKSINDDLSQALQEEYVSRLMNDDALIGQWKELQTQTKQVSKPADDIVQE